MTVIGDVDLTIELADLEMMSVARLVLRRSLPPLPVEHASLYFGAVTEIMTNALNAHHSVSSTAPITVSVRFGASPAVVVSDRGPGFDLEAANAADGGSGRGLAIARAVCPTMTIDSSAAGTSVVLPYPGDEDE